MTAYQLYEAACATCCTYDLNRNCSANGLWPTTQTKKTSTSSPARRIFDGPICNGGRWHRGHSRNCCRSRNYIADRLFCACSRWSSLLSSIKTRFSKQATEFMTRITAFSPENWVSENDVKVKVSKKMCVVLQIITALIEASVAVAQYNLFIRPINNDGADDVCKRNERSHCKSPASLLDYMHKKKLSRYLLNYKLLEICATIPVTSACNERSHSKLQLIKTETRSTSGDERTEALVIGVEKQIWNSLSLSSLVDAFALKPRKLKL